MVRLVFPLGQHTCSGDVEDDHQLVFERLAHHFETARIELGQLVEEQNARCAREISPGCGQRPPPTNPACDMV